MTDANKDLAGELRALLDKATPGPWEAELDMFDEYMIEATVCDGPEVRMLARIDTGIQSHQGAQPDKWTPEDAATKKALWDKAFASSAWTDARLIAALRNAAHALLAVVEAVNAQIQRGMIWDNDDNGELFSALAALGVRHDR